jgi:hypothetical protein
MLRYPDSPAGLLAWIYEKLHAWTEDYQWSKDEILTWVMLYWVSHGGPAPALRYYKESLNKYEEVAEREICMSQYSPTPFGVSVFPKEIFLFPLECVS